MQLDKRDRIQRMLRHDTVDRPPVSLWRHFYREERTAAGMAEAMINFQRAYDWDYMKVNPRSSFFVEDFGSRYVYFASDRRRGELVEPAVKREQDLVTLSVQGTGSPVWGEHLRALKTIRRALDGEVPFLMTLFTPLAVLGRLIADHARTRTWMLQCPGAIHRALDVVTRSLIHFVHGCLEEKVDGFFYATTDWCTRDSLDTELFNIFSRPYDAKLLEAAGENTWFNMMHVCRSNNMLLDVLDYPVQCFHWDAVDAGNPGIRDPALRGRVVIGGLDQGLFSDPRHAAEIRRQARAAMDATACVGFGLGAGCVIPVDAHPINIEVARNAVA